MYFPKYLSHLPQLPFPLWSPQIPPVRHPFPQISPTWGFTSFRCHHIPLHVFFTSSPPVPSMSFNPFLIVISPTPRDPQAP